MKTILIGGVADGERVEIHPTAEGLRVPIYKTPKVSSNMTEGLLEPSFDVEEYDRQTFRGRDRTWDVLAKRGMTPEEVMEALISGYRQPRVDESAPAPRR